MIKRIVYGDPKEIMQLLGVDSGRKINTAYFRSKDLYRNRPNTLPMDYSFKRGFKPDLERIQKVLEEGFPTEIKQEDGKLLLSYGALKSICVSITGKKLTVTTESAIGANDVVAMDTNKRFRNFLEKATGYNGKQRLQMAKKELAKGAD